MNSLNTYEYKGEKKMTLKLTSTITNCMGSYHLIQNYNPNKNFNEVKFSQTL